jgi:ligand-binding sensor domain-containing protein
MDTLLLDTSVWDLVLDANGNIAMATHPYAIAQDVASAVRLFAGELWYDTRQGIPYFEHILGQLPPLQYINAQVEKAAMTVPDVVSARCIVADFTNRVISGQVQIIDKTGATNNVQF